MTSKLDGRSLRILFLTQVLPYPLVGGQKIRAYYMLKYLAQRHKVTLVSFTRQDDRSEYVAHLRTLCSSVYTVPIVRARTMDVVSFLKSLITRLPAVIHRDSQKGMKALLGRLADKRQFDVVHADQTAMAQYALMVVSRQQKETANRPVSILDQHNALFQVVRRQAGHERGWQKYIWRREAKLMARYEKRLCRQFDRIITVSREDKASLLSLYHGVERADVDSRMVTIPISVDPAEKPFLDRDTEDTVIIHIGTMFWPPNIEGVLWFAREVLPKVHESFPSGQFVIVGKNPPASIRSLDSDSSDVPARITVTGFVDDPVPLLEKSAVFVVPVRAGSGMRVKILDAWLWGIPVVSTSIGAEGIEITNGENILIADDAESFSQAVIRLLVDNELAHRLRQNGRRWVEERYHWRRNYGEVEKLYADARLDFDRA